MIRVYNIHFPVLFFIYIHLYECNRSLEDVYYVNCWRISQFLSGPWLSALSSIFLFSLSISLPVLSSLIHCSIRVPSSLAIVSLSGYNVLLFEYGQSVLELQEKISSKIVYTSIYIYIFISESAISCIPFQHRVNKHVTGTKHVIPSIR